MQRIAELHYKDQSHLHLFNGYFNVEEGLEIGDIFDEGAAHKGIGAEGCVENPSDRLVEVFIAVVEVKVYNDPKGRGLPPYRALVDRLVGAVTVSVVGFKLDMELAQCGMFRDEDPAMKEGEKGVMYGNDKAEAV